MKIQEIEEAVRDVYLIKDTGIIKLIAGMVLANRKNRTDPAIWLILLGGSSSGKTIMLQLISKCGKWVVPVDTLTTNTFASGFKTDQETSLLKTANHGILVFKDFTTITSMNDDTLRDIMGQLRAIYDGEFIKRTGNANSTIWNGKVGILGAGTIDVQRKMRQYSKNGERFLNYIPEVADPKEIGYRAMANQKTIREKESYLADLFKQFIDEKLEETFDVDNSLFEKEMVDIAEFATLARSPVEMNFKNPAIVNFVGDREIPGRMAMMLKSLGVGIMVACGEKKLTVDIAKILYKVALDSIPVERKIVLRELAKYRSSTTRNLAIKLNYTTETVKAWCNQVNALKMIDREANSGGSQGEKWTLKPQYKNLLIEYLDIDDIDEELSVTEEEEKKNAYAVDAIQGMKVPDMPPSDDDEDAQKILLDEAFPDEKKF